jgi:hypothetical protein
VLKLIGAVMAAAAIASVLTLPTATSPRTDAIAKPAEVMPQADRTTPSAGSVRMSDAQSILFETSQIQDW